MSAQELRKELKKIQLEMNDFDNSYLDDDFLSSLNQLSLVYGEFIGQAKGQHPYELNQLSLLDSQIVEYLQLVIKVTDESSKAFMLVNLASGKISELISYVSALNTKPPQETVSKNLYDALFREKEDLKKTIGIMVQYKGLPELNTLMENAKNNSLPLDEYWVLALCSSNLIEAVVNKKLDQLGEKTEGNFEERFRKLCKVIKEKEGRDISQLLPSAVYKVRNKLDHSDFNIITPKEARDICKMVIDFMNEVFQQT